MASDQPVAERSWDDPLVGRWYSLVPVSPRYHSAIHALSHREQNSFRWRYRGTIPPFPAFEQSIYAGVLIQFVVVAKDDLEHVAGLVVAYSASHQDGHCYMGAVMNPNEGAGTAEGIALFLRYVFLHWPFHKIYLETPEFNAVQFESAVKSGLIVEEGRLRNHVYYDDKHWDQIVYALYRENAATFSSKFGGLFLNRGEKV